MLYSNKRFDHAAALLYRGVGMVLANVPPEIKNSIQEIRLHTGQPLMLYNGTRPYFVTKQGQLTTMPTKNSYIVTSDDIENSFKTLCGYAVHSHVEEIKNGYIALSGGHRAGIAGQAVYADGQITTLRELTSINLRIARQIPGCGDALAATLFATGLPSTLIVGAPSSGKTTLLRDLARKLSAGECGRFYKVSIVDERGEIAAISSGIVQNDLGPCCDIITGCQKSHGMQMALRSLSPDILICDEVGTQEEIAAISASLNAGVKVMATVHAGSLQQLLLRPQGKALLATGAFEKIVLLEGCHAPCTVAQIQNCNEIPIC